MISRSRPLSTTATTAGEGGGGEGMAVAARARVELLLLRPRGHRPAYARTSVRRITGRTSTRPPLRLLLLLVS